MIPAPAFVSPRRSSGLRSSASAVDRLGLCASPTTAIRVRALSQPVRFAEAANGPPTSAASRSSPLRSSVSALARLAGGRLASPMGPVSSASISAEAGERNAVRPMPVGPSSFTAPRARPPRSAGPMRPALAQAGVRPSRPCRVTGEHRKALACRAVKRNAAPRSRPGLSSATPCARLAHDRRAVERPACRAVERPACRAVEPSGLRASPAPADPLRKCCEKFPELCS
jgi:hypothetical protein